MRLVIFDKDSTLVMPKSGATFVQNPQDQMLIPGTVSMIKRFADEGCYFAIASNQGGIEKGHKTLEDAIEEMYVSLKLLEDLSGVEVDSAYFCPDFGGEECYAVNIASHPETLEDTWDVEAVHQHTYTQQFRGAFRKPDAGMILAAIELGIYLDPGVLMIGDRPEDQGAAQVAGVEFAWIWDINPEYPQALRA